MSNFPFNITNPGINFASVLTSAEGQFVTDLYSLSYATGDILYYDGAALTNLAVGTEGYVLKVVSGIPAWAAAAGGGSMEDFIVAGDAGSPQTISDGNTLTITGGTGIDTSAGATDTVTIALDSATQTSLGKADSALQGDGTAGYVPFYGTADTLTSDAHFTYDQVNDVLHVHKISGDGTDGLLIESDNGTDIGILGAANTANVTWYGTHNFPASGLQIGSSNPFSDSSGTLTLQNVDALDATTESTIEAAIDTLANLTSIQGRTVTLADAGADAILGWDDSESAYENLTQAEVLAIIGDSSDTAKGVVELAIASEVTAGTDATRAVTPDALAGSEFGKRTIAVLVSGSASGDTALATGDGLVAIPVDTTLNGMNLVAVKAYVSTVSSSGAPLFQVRRSRRSSATARTTVDMLSTGVSIDANEFESADAATAAVINTSNDDVQTGDILLIDCDTAGTGTKGAQVMLTFQLP